MVQTPTDWIEWQGGECPVDSEEVIDARFRDGDVEYGIPAGLYAGTDCTNCSWHHSTSNTGDRWDDIVAYRAHQSEEDDAGIFVSGDFL